MRDIITLSPNFYLSEFVQSDTATRYSIDNYPDDDALQNLIALCEHVLQPLRDYFDTPITVTSGYRSEALNAKLRGSKTSQHMTGQAADIVVSGMSNREVADYIRHNLSFDQLIYEHPDEDNDDEIDWIHVSYNRDGNREESLTAQKKFRKGKYHTVYTAFFE